MNRNTGTRILILLAAAALVSLAGCKDFSFFTELGAKGTISLSPPEITVITGSLVTFSASGGTPPYTFEMASGSGTVDPATGQYEALAQGIDVVMATDSIGQSGTATVTVVNTLEELKISPTSASVSVGNSISFVATGGVGPYTYSIQTNSSGCSIAASTGEYTAGSVTGVSDTIVVTDSDTPPQSCSVPAVVSVSAAVTNVDYSISADSFPAGAMAGESLSGDFTIFNGGSATGTADVSWWLFISADGVFGGAGETLVDNGDEPADIPASGTLVVTPTGSWPADLLPGSYTLFVMLASPDDLNHGNNVYDAGAINLAVPNVDYRVTSVSVTGGYLHVGAAMSGELVLENAGTDDGSEDLTWKVYVSTNTAVDVGDTLIDSGTEGAMTSAEVPRTISFGGTWPASADSYYLVAEVSAADDEAAGNSGNNTTASLSAYPVDYPDVDYQVLSVSHTSGTAAGGGVDGELVLDNIGADDGSSTVTWKVFASANTTVDAGDALLDWSTTEPAMDATDPPLTIAFSGTWPAEPGWYYLVAQVSAFDETQAGNDSNNETATASMVDVVVADVDYYADGISAAAGTAGGALSCSFTLRNGGSDPSAGTVAWNLYASTNTALDAGDYLAAYGTAGPLGAAPSSAVITPGGANWPVVAGNYFLIVEVESLEDIAAGTTANDVAVSASTFAVAPAAGSNVDYIVDQVLFDSGSSTHIPAGTAKGTFVYKNAGLDNGAQQVSWEAYASLDTTIDAGDSLIDSNTGLMPLNAGITSAPITFAGVWPLDYGSYYLIVRVTAGDEVDPLNNSSATLTPEAVGYFDESLHEPNDDYATLTDFYDLGVTFKPGMSIQVSGTMSSTDMDDVMAFDTGTCSMITFAVTYSPQNASEEGSIRIFLWDATPAQVGGILGGTDAISLNWTVDATGVQRYLDLDNLGAAQKYNGSYTCVITGH